MLKILTGHAMLIDVILPFSLSRYITVLRIFLFTAYSMFPNGSKSISSSMYPKNKKKYIYSLFYSPSDKKFHSHRVVHVTRSWHVSIPNVNFSQFHPLPIASFRAEQPWCPKRATLPPNSESVSLPLSPSLWLITIPMIFLETPNPFISFYFWSRFWPQLLEFRGSPSFQIFEILFNRRALLIS